MAYAARGWSLVALHWITAAGQCSCGTPGCKSAGKHPRDRAWQQRGESPGRWMDGGPENIGIRTGAVSGFWVLDYDPEDARIEGIHLRDRLLDAGYHPHVRTGGGGYHYRFALPDFEVRNRQSAGGGRGRTHSLPAGWDVRGEGGQVVAPPSVSGKGVYVELDEAKRTGYGLAYEPPSWLLDMIRPVEKMDAPLNHTVPLPSNASAVSPATGVTEAYGANGATGGSSHSAERVQAYATAAATALCDEYAGLVDGRRGEAAAAFARRMIEIANMAGWSVNVGGVLYGWFEGAMTAAARNGGGGGYAPHEISGQWARALEHVGGRAAVMPPGPDVLPGLTPPFVAAGAAAPALPGIVEPGDAQPSVNGGSPVTGPTGEPDPWLRAVAKRVWQRDVDDAAERFRLERERGARPSLASRVLTGDTLDSVPDPVPLIDGWLFLDSTARINGRPGQGKSFVAADLLCSVATGTPWGGIPVRQGPVLAVVAEGVSGFKLRIRAWESDRGRAAGAALHLVPFPVQTLDDAAWQELIDYATALRPVLITLDTQARISEGARENDAADMGRVLGAVERLRAATGACVTLVHHAGKAGDTETGRGSNAMEGGVTSEFFVTLSGHTVTVKNTRQKDIETGAKAVFAIKPVDKSAVLSWSTQVVEPTGDIWRGQAVALYEIMRTAKADGETWAGIFKDAKAHPAFVGRHTKFINEAWNNLLLRGLVIRRDGTQRFSVHVLEVVGEAGVLTPNVGTPLPCNDPPGWHTYATDLIKDDADFTMNLGRGGRLGK